MLDGLCSRRTYNNEALSHELEGVIRVNGQLVRPSITDAFVNFFIEDAIIGSAALFTGHFPRPVSGLEGRFLHRSVTH